MAGLNAVWIRRLVGRAKQSYDASARSNTPLPMDTITLSSKGQLVIPKAVRDHAQIAPGSLLEVRYVDGEIRLRPVAPQAATTLDQVSGCLAKPGRKLLSGAKTQAIIKAKLGSTPRVASA